MVTNLKIKNFKSIKDLRLACKRVNVFIGDPNSGKSNILESLALLNKNENLRDCIRFENASQLFCDFDTSLSIEVEIDEYRIEAIMKDNEFKIESWLGMQSPFLVKMNLKGDQVSSSHNDYLNNIPKVRYYRFNQDVKFLETEHNYLNTPFGSNLPSMVIYNKELREQIQMILESLGYKLLFRPYDVHFEIYREQDGFSVSFPISVISDTVKRMIFYLSIIESNGKPTLVFEEPESNTFPLYIKYLAERIGAYSDNQYFITTHNPYFLQSVIEKTPSKDLSINLVEIVKYKTVVTSLKKRNVEEILGLNSDVFLNFDKVKNP